MVKKFVDEFNNIGIFIQSDKYLVFIMNGEPQYTVTSIATLPETIEEARRISKLNIWYPINEIS